MTSLLMLLTMYSVKKNGFYCSFLPPMLERLFFYKRANDKAVIKGRYTVIPIKSIVQLYNLKLE